MKNQRVWILLATTKWVTIYNRPDLTQSPADAGLFYGRNMRELTLYGTSACHLCELAEAVLANLLASYPHWQIELVDIADSDALIAEYGQRIPVLSGGGRELNWPFDEASVEAFVSEETLRCR